MTTEVMETLSPESTPAQSGPATATWSSNGIPLAEKRREMRYATCEPVEVYLLDMNNLRLNGVVRDMSKSGMRIELDMPLKAGDRLEVVLQNTAIVFVEVRYCRRSGESYHAGTKIDDVYYPKRVPSRLSNAARSETGIKQLTHQIRVVENRQAEPPEPARLERAADRLVRLPHPSKAGIGGHLDRNDIENLLRLRLSETKAAVLERHLASCDQCLDLVLLALEERASSSSPWPNDATGQA